MTPAVYDQTAVDIEAKVRQRRRRTAPTGSAPAGACSSSAGWLEVYGKGGRRAARRRGREQRGRQKRQPMAATKAQWKPNGANGTTDRRTRPAAPRASSEGEVLTLVTPPGVIAEQKFTQPPARYNEGSLVRELEEARHRSPEHVRRDHQQGAGARLRREGRRARFRPTLLGKFVVDGLVEERARLHGPGVHREAWKRSSTRSRPAARSASTLLARFYKRFREQLDKSQEAEALEARAARRPTSICERVRHGQMLKRWSKNGWFLGCSDYPKCKNTRDLGPDGNGTRARPSAMTDYKCDKCGKPMVIKQRSLRRVPLLHRLPRRARTRGRCRSACPAPSAAATSSRSAAKARRQAFYGCSKYNDET